MNINEYIESGILEDYALGLASEQDAREIERLAKLHPEIQEKISAFQYPLEQYADKFRKSPPPALKEKIWSTIQKEENVAHEKPKDVKLIDKSRFNNRKWMVAASLILLIGSSILNITLYNKWQSSQKKVTELNTEKENYAQALQVQKTALEQVQNEFAFLLQPSTETIALNGVPKFPDAQATVYWNKNSKVVYLAVNNLPVPPSEKQYQLWAIIDGNPVDAGVFEVGERSVNTVQKMKNFETAQAFAITLEKKGGNPSPTMDAMYVIGNV